MRIAHCSRPIAIATAAMALAAAFLLPGCRSMQRFPGQWLDGSSAQADDFSKRITSHLYENGMMVGVGNDDRCLYVFFTPDIRHRNKPASRVQLTLWLDEDGGKAKRLGLVHRSGPSGQRLPRPEAFPEKEGGQPGDRGDRPAPAADKTMPAVLQVLAPGQGKEFLIAADGSQGPAIRLDDDWGDFAYQWRIPFQGAGDWPGLKGGPGRIIGIGLIWRSEPLDRPSRKDGARGRGGPGMGPPPGMEGDGPDSGRGMPGEAPTGRRSLWLKIPLVGK